MTNDVDLVLAAQAGEAGCLGLLLQRHQARMRAVALGVLGHRPEVDDAVQEACLTVVRRIGDLREPRAWSGWLRTIVLNQARAQLRSRAPVPVPDLDRALDDLDPARLLDRQATGDWLWHAVNQLSPQHQLVTMLRYFTDVTAYEQIALVLDVPVGTVRSRLSHARARLLDALAATADEAHGDQRAMMESRRREAGESLSAGRAGRYGEAMAAFCVPEIEMVWGRGKRTYGYAYPTYAMHRDVGDGVTFRLAEVIAGADTMIWRTDLISPPEDPSHCPPDALWVHTLRDGRSARIRLFHPLRVTQPT